MKTKKEEKWLQRIKEIKKVFILKLLRLSRIFFRYRKTGAVIKLKWLNGDKWLVTIFDEILCVKLWNIERTFLETRITISS